MSEDNWIHRSDNMRCKTCMFFVAKMPAVIVKPGVAVPPEDIGPGKVLLAAEDLPEFTPCKIGRCRRHAPADYGWPVMFVTDWCGDHRLDENKI